MDKPLPTAIVRVLPADLRNYLVLLHDRNAARNARIRLQCLRIGAVLARAGFRAALLKGAAWLFDESSPAASDRMLRDIDLVIAPNDFEAALRTLAASGYREASGIYVELEHFHCAPMICEGAEVCVEVHRDLDYRAEFLPSNEVIASSSEIAPGLLLPHSRHRIGHNVVHAQRLNGDFAGGVLSLRDTLDLARLVAANAPKLIGPRWRRKPGIEAISITFRARFMRRIAASTVLFLRRL